MEIYQVVAVAFVGGLIALLFKIVWDWLKLRNNASTADISKSTTDEIVSKIKESNKDCKEVVVARIGQLSLRLEKHADQVDKEHDEISKFLADHHNCLDAIYKMHCVYDEDGAPKWYFPNSVSIQLAKLVDSQTKMVTLLELIHKKIET